jgi:AAA+ superfamily predicted ATPase
MEKTKQSKIAYSKHEKKLNQRNLKEFREILKNSSLSDIDKSNIEFISEYFQDKHDPKLASRLFLFHGNPGIGKTHLAEKLLQTLEVQILYMSCADFHFKHGKKCRTFAELIRALDNSRKQVIFLDDLSYLFQLSEGDFVSVDSRSFMSILDMVKNNSNKVMLATMNSFHCLDERMIDRIEVKIKFGLPNDVNKKTFLDMNYKSQLKNSHRSYISDNSIGYNYRDIPELVKLAYRLGRTKINMGSIKEAIKMYRPTQLYGFDVHNGINLGLKDVIGKPDAKKIMQGLVRLYKNNDDVGEKLGLKRGNLLLFHGLPGTGKSFMARAIAGEMEFPLIYVQAGHIHGRDPFRCINYITDMGKRYRNCVIFIDEAEKILGNGRFEEDNPVLGELHRCIDNADGDDIRSIFILAINDISRFGETLLDRFVLVSFEMPSFDERVAYFEQKIKHVRQGYKLDFPCIYLARVTENMSYRDLDRYWNDLMFHYLDNKTLDSGVISGLVARNNDSFARNETMYS